jgi:hypothetical protein
MKRSKYFCLAVICLLLAGLIESAPAQQKAVSYSAGIEGQSGPAGMATVNARQFSDGQLAFDSETQSETAFGVGFLGQTAGDFPGTLTVSLNRATSVGTTTINGTSPNLITGGIWTLSVYRTDVSGGFVGSLFGTISSGQIVPTKNPNKSEVSMTFNIQGGTLAYQGATGTARFAGTLTLDGRSNGNELEGTLLVNVQTD